MKIGYIISETTIDLKNFENLKSLDNINDDLPKLIVGREYSKKLNIKTSLLNKVINKNTFWTFSQDEKKSEYKDDIESFKNLCYQTFMKSIPYFNLDPFSLNYTQTKRLILKVKELKNGLIYDEGKMCYIYFNKVIFGIHWETFEYIGLSREKIIKYLKTNNFIILPKNEIFNECMEESKILNDKKIIPYLYYLKENDEKNIVGDVCY
jgi:hypothetical protein